MSTNSVLIVPSKNKNITPNHYLKSNFRVGFLSNPNIVKDFSHKAAKKLPFFCGGGGAGKGILASPEYFT